MAFVVVGAGIVGLAVARELCRRQPGAKVTVVDKEPAVGQHQTGHNSGVVHAGLYYPPGSLKAELCARGRLLMRDFCRERDLPYVECGKVVVARDASELTKLADIETRARANGVPGLRRLTGQELRRVEPHAAGVAALHSPHTAIVDFSAVAAALAAEGPFEVRLRFDVTGFEVGKDQVAVRGRDQEIEADRVVICAGLQSSRLAAAAGAPDGPVIVPFRGEYWRLRPSRSDLVKGLIYPVPDPRYPFLGVHFTRRVDGHVDVGPNAVLALAPEGYRRRDVDLGFVARTVTTPTFARMGWRHRRAAVSELAGSLSKRVFLRRAATLLPGISAADVEPAPAGVRAQAVEADGSLVDDFRISRVGPVVAVVNAPSPAATSSLAIAGYICDQIR